MTRLSITFTSSFHVDPLYLLQLRSQTSFTKMSHVKFAFSHVKTTMCTEILTREREITSYENLTLSQVIVFFHIYVNVKCKSKFSQSNYIHSHVIVVCHMLIRVVFYKEFFSLFFMKEGIFFLWSPLISSQAKLYTNHY